MEKGFTVLTKTELEQTWQEAKKEINGGNKMESIKESAMAYEPKQTKNIADLDKVSVELNLEDREGTDKEGKTFRYKVVVVNGEEYRVPGKVIGDLKSILDKKPNLQTFSVSRKGMGMNTVYTVIPMD